MQEVYLYNCIKIFSILSRLDNIEFVGTNNVSYKLQILRYFEGSSKSLFTEIKNKVLEEIKLFVDKLDMKNKPTSDIDEIHLEEVLKLVDWVVSRDMSKGIDQKKLRSLYQACLASFSIVTKDYDQFVIDIKTYPEALNLFAKKYELDNEVFKLKIETYIN